MTFTFIVSNIIYRYVLLSDNINCVIISILVKLYVIKNKKNLSVTKYPTL